LTLVQPPRNNREKHNKKTFCKKGIAGDVATQHRVQVPPLHHFTGKLVAGASALTLILLFGLFSRKGSVAREYASSADNAGEKNH